MSKNIKNGEPKDYFGKIDEIQKLVWSGMTLDWRPSDLWRPPVHNYERAASLTVDISRKDETSSGYWSNEGKKYESEKDFLSFFNKTIIDNFKEGKEDFKTRIMNTESHFNSGISVSEYLGDTSEKTCLEIGFGGGRLLNAACENFKHCVGVDIHNYFERVDKILQNREKKNYNLIRSEEIKSHVEDNSIDLAFSFIVFQHVDSLEIVRSYLKETKRFLNKSGLCVYYFGLNNYMPSIGALELVGHDPGCYSLLFNPHRIEQEFLGAGLELISIKPSHNWRQLIVVARSN